MTNEQKRIRNWQKMRLMGFCLNEEGLSEEERRVYNFIKELKFEMLNHWDSETEILIGHPLSPYKCCRCQRRVKGDLVMREAGFDGEDLYFCRKHLEEHYAEQRQICTPIGGLVAED